MKLKTTIKKIKKRSGRVVAFRISKIKRVIWQAAKAAGGTDRFQAEKITAEVIKEMERRFNATLVPEVEQVQDLIVKILKKKGHEKTCKAFVLYRDLHAKMRDIRSLVDTDELIRDYLDEKDWRVKENANMTYSLQGLNNHVASIISSNYWLNQIYPREVRKAHSFGDLHIHDLALVSAYCTGWDLKDLLIRGFGGVSGKLNSKPPKHFATALGQLVNFFYTLQGEVAGAVAVANFDTYMAPFIAYDKLSYKEAKQAMQEFIYNMNVPTRVGFQSPFTNVTLDLIPPKQAGEEAVIIGGNPVKAQYKDFQKEIDLFNKAFAEVMLEGDAQGRVFSFPIPTYSISKDFDWDNPKLKPVWEMTKKYGIPYFANYVNSDMSPDDARSMCPLAGFEKVLIRSKRGRNLEYCQIRNIYEGNTKENNYEIYSDGKFIKGSFHKYTNQDMLEVILENGHKLVQSTEHMNFILKGKNEKQEELAGKKLKKGMFLPYSLKKYLGEGGESELGYFVGAYAGDGSFDKDTSVIFSLENEKKKHVISKLYKIAKKYFGGHSASVEYSDTKLYTLKIHSRAAVGLCKDFVMGSKREKHYRARLFSTSLGFRNQVLKGHYETDGGNRGRIYTSSLKMVQSLNMLAATLGTTTSIYKDNCNNRFGKEPNYSVLVYKLNREKYGSFWFKKNNKLWVKIKSITKKPKTTAYCFTVADGEPVFTVGTSGILTHNCRLRLDNRVLRKRGGLFAANPLTGSIGVVTINMPRIGFLAQDEKEFFARLEKLMDLAKESLFIKRKAVESFTKRGLYPYCSYYLDNVFERFGEYWKNHFNTIGLLGMNEACINFLGKGKGIVSPEGHNFSLKVMDYMRKKLLQYQKESGDLFNLEATPGEGTSYRFVRLDRQYFPAIKVANEGHKNGFAPYYTNSTQLPVGYTDDIFEALSLQDDLQGKYTGGTVLHGFLGEAPGSADIVKKTVRKISENFRLPYFTLTPTFSVCPKHGYLKGEHEYCPKCDQEIGYIENRKAPDRR